jgi:uncharacterized protein YggU (UPF0235/DUF167 family)
MLSQGLGIALGVSIIITAFLFNQNGNLKEDLGAHKTALDQAVLTNATNVKNFDDVNDRLTVCVDQSAVDEAANEVTIANLEARYARLEIRKNRVEIRREEIFRDPKCAELRDLDMAAICPDWAAELRIRAATIGGDGDT